MQEMIESGLLVVVTILSIILLCIGQGKNSGMTKKQKVMLFLRTMNGKLNLKIVFHILKQMIN